MSQERKDAHEPQIDWESLTKSTSVEQVQVPAVQEKEINWQALDIEKLSTPFSAPADMGEREIDWSKLKPPEGD